MSKSPIRAAAGMVLLIVAGCGGTPPPSPEAMDASYERALQRTAATAVVLDDQAVVEQMERLRGFFTRMDATAIRHAVDGLYAPDAYLNDNLVALEGAAAIADYFAETMTRVSSLRVDLLSMAHAGPDYFVRWRMTIESPQLGGGRPLKSYGMTHFRFDETGRVLLHRDFWDAGTGLYEHLPVVGSILRRVRAAAH
jgi:hypothetical protein